MYNTKFDGWMFDAMADYSHEQEIVKHGKPNYLSKLLVGISRKLESYGICIGGQKQIVNTAQSETSSAS